MKWLDGSRIRGPEDIQRLLETSRLIRPYLTMAVQGARLRRCGEGATAVARKLGQRSNTLLLGNLDLRVGQAHRRRARKRSVVRNKSPRLGLWVRQVAH